MKHLIPIASIIGWAILAALCFAALNAMAKENRQASEFEYYSAFGEGAEAAGFGFTPKDCPYGWPGPKRRGWNDGLIQVYRELEEKGGD